MMEDQRKVSLDFDLSYEEMISAAPTLFNLDATFIDRHFRSLMGTAQFLVLLALTVLFANLEQMTSIPVNIFTFGVPAVLLTYVAHWTIFKPLARNYLARRATTKFGEPMSNHVELDEHGLRIWNDDVDVLYRWSCAKLIAKVKHGVVLIMKGSSILIPESALGTREQASQLIRFAMERMPPEARSRSTKDSTLVEYL